MSNLSELLGGGGGGSVLEATASGTLANGDLVSVNSDGTVSVTAGQTSSIGSEVNWSNPWSTNTEGANGVFDPSTNKVVLIYKGESYNRGYAIVGTVSGSSISFGSATQYSTDSGIYSPGYAVFDSNANKVVILYPDASNSNYGTAKVCTISGSSISFGSPVVFQSDFTAFGSACFDSNSNKIVAIVYNEKAIVGTVSGTTTSWGTPVSAPNDTGNNPAFDTTNNKVIYVYLGASNYPSAVVGTVSGTSISFGTPFVIQSLAASQAGCAYDASANKILGIWNTGSNGYATVGTVSGTSISFTTSVIFNAGTTNFISVAYASGAATNIIAWSSKVLTAKISGSSITFGSTSNLSETEPFVIYDSNVNKAVIHEQNVSAQVYTPEFTNYTSYIGISDAAYSSGATATVQIVGSVDDAQSGLSAGVTYYVQSDGSLDTAADTVPVLAGTAVASTKLIIKG